MHHLSRALATARIEDLHREAAQRHMIRLARGVTHEPTRGGREPRTDSERTAVDRPSRRAFSP
jgi:hypothetical protein